MDIEKKIHKRYRNKKTDARRRGIEFSITLEQFTDIVMQETCFYSKKKLTVFDDDFTIERLDSNLGYVDGNVVICKQEYNNVKSKFSKEQINNIYKALNEQ